jgi:hypothetical protein
MRATQKERERLFSPTNSPITQALSDKFVLFMVLHQSLSLSLSEHKASGGAMSNNRQEAARAEKKTV